MHLGEKSFATTGDGLHFLIVPTLQRGNAFPDAPALMGTANDRAHFTIAGTTRSHREQTSPQERAMPAMSVDRQQGAA